MLKPHVPAILGMKAADRWACAQCFVRGMPRAVVGCSRSWQPRLRDAEVWESAARAEIVSMYNKASIDELAQKHALCLYLCLCLCLCPSRCLCLSLQACLSACLPFCDCVSVNVCVNVCVCVVSVSVSASLSHQYQVDWGAIDSAPSRCRSPGTCGSGYPAVCTASKSATSDTALHCQ